jgi:autotransporter strand-loop-strand O-heptosyltransferase
MTRNPNNHSLPVADDHDPALSNIVRNFKLLPPPSLPTQNGPGGIRFDFNDGARVFLPQGQWLVEFVDDDSGNSLFSCAADFGWVLSAKKYFLPIRIIVRERDNPVPVLVHTLNLWNKPVIIKFPPDGSLGDLIGWLTYVDRFQKKHQCRLKCAVREDVAELVADQYPDITFSDLDALKTQDPYATYKVGLFFADPERNYQPIDFRYTGLHRVAAYILGVDPGEAPPHLNLSTPKRIKEPYVCIATKSTSQGKFWNNGFGWPSVITYLRQLGYRVLCIDGEKTVGEGFIWNQFPHGAEDFTGQRPLQDRVDLLKDADFFIGLSSGLSWLAWAAKAPVIMISGFTLPSTEFFTPYRVFSTLGCAGCWEDFSLKWNRDDFLFCPRHQKSDRQFECTRLISPKQVINQINKLIDDHGLTPPVMRHKARTGTA